MRWPWQKDEPPSVPQCDHDWRIHPNGWEEYSPLSLMINGGATNAGGVKHERRLFVCAKCDKGKYEHRTTRLSETWARVDDNSKDPGPS